MAPAISELPNLELWQNDRIYRAKIKYYLGREPSEEEFTDESKKEAMAEELHTAWEREKERLLAEQRKKFPTRVHQVLWACQTIQDKFAEFSRTYLDVTITLGVKLGVGVGRCDMIHIGGVMNRLE